MLALINMVRALSSLTMSSEEVHQRLLRESRSTDMNKQFPYFRFDVEREVGDIGLEAWKEFEEIAAYTEAYMGEYEAEERRRMCVKILIKPPISTRIPIHLSPLADLD